MPGMPGMPSAMPGAGGADDLDDDPLSEGMGDDDEGFHQADKAAGADDEDEDGEGRAEDDDAFHQAEKSGDDEEDLVDPDDDRPNFGGTGKGSGEDDLDDDPLAGSKGDDAGKPDKKKPKKKSKPIDPAYVTVAVLSIIVVLVGSVLFMARDQLAEIWPGIKGVYEALNLDDDEAEGLRLSAPQPVRIMKGGVQTLVVSGFITNLSPEIQTVPNIKLMLVNKDNEVFQETTAPPDASSVDPNSTLPYRIELQLPVESATSLRVDWD
ncbi:MAG: DUF3426 domain-containing protein [Rhodospirillaceae bacterium]|nr:DUF3426 domain-containing protein [Rhodospirillaceae bacterium]